MRTFKFIDTCTIRAMLAHALFIPFFNSVILVNSTFADPPSIRNSNYHYSNDIMASAAPPINETATRNHLYRYVRSHRKKLELERRQWEDSQRTRLETLLHATRAYENELEKPRYKEALTALAYARYCKALFTTPQRLQDRLTQAAFRYASLVSDKPQNTTSNTAAEHEYQKNAAASYAHVAGEYYNKVKDSHPHLAAHAQAYAESASIYANAVRSALQNPRAEEMIRRAHQELVNAHHRLVANLHSPGILQNSEPAHIPSHSNRIMDLQSQLTRDQSDLHNHEARLQTLEDKTKRLSASLTQARGSGDSPSPLYSHLRKLLASANEEYHQAQEDTQITRQRIASSLEGIHQLLKYKQAQEESEVSKLQIQIAQLAAQGKLKDAQTQLLQGKLVEQVAKTQQANEATRKAWKLLEKTDQLHALRLEEQANKHRVTLNNHESRIQKLEKEVRKLSTQLGAIRKQQGEQAAHSSPLWEQMISLQQQMNEAQDLANQEKRKVAALLSDIRHQFTDREDRLRSELQEAQAELARSKSKRISQKTTLEELTETIRHLEEELTQASDDAQKAKKQFDHEMRTTQESHEAEINRVRQAIQEQEKEVQKLKAEVSRKSAELAAEKDRNSARHAELSAQLEKQRHFLELARREALNGQEHLHAAIAASAQYNQDREHQHQRELQTSREKLEKLTSNHQEQSNRANLLEKRAKDLESQLEQARQHALQSQARVEQFGATLKAKVSQLEGSYEASLAQVKHLEAELTRHRSEKEASLSETADLQKKLESMMAEMHLQDQAQQTLHEQMETHVALQQALRDQDQREIEQLKASKQTDASRLHQLEQELLTRDDKLNQTRIEADQLKHHVESVHAAVLRLNDLHQEELLHAKEQRDQEEKKFRDQIQELTQELDNLRKTHESAETDNGALLRKNAVLERRLAQVKENFRTFQDESARANEKLFAELDAFRSLLATDAEQHQIDKQEARANREKLTTSKTKYKKKASDLEQELLKQKSLLEKATAAAHDANQRQDRVSQLLHKLQAQQQTALETQANENSEMTRTHHQQLTALNSDITDLKEQLKTIQESSKAETAKLRKQKQELQNNLALLKAQQRRISEEDLQRQQIHLEMLAKLKADKERRANQDREEIEQLHAQRELLTSSNEAKASELQALNQKLREYEASTKSTATTLERLGSLLKEGEEAFKAKLQKKKEKIQAARAEAKTLQDRIAQNEKELEQQGGTHKELSDKHLELQAAHEELKRQAATEAASMKKVLERLETDYREQAQRAEENLKEAERTIQTLTLTKNSETEQVNQLRETVRQLEAQNTEATRKVKETANSLTAHLEAAEEEASKQRDFYSQLARQQKAHNQGLESKIQETEAKLRKLSIEHQAESNEGKKLQAELTAVQAQYAQALEREKNTERLHLEALAEIETLQAQEEENRTKARTQQRQNQDLEQAKKILQEHINALQRENSAVLDEQKRLQAALERTTKDAAHKDAHATKLQTDLDTARLWENKLGEVIREIARVKGTISAYQAAEGDRVNQTLAEAQAQLERLTADQQRLIEAYQDSHSGAPASLQTPPFVVALKEAEAQQNLIRETLEAEQSRHHELAEETKKRAKQNKLIAAKTFLREIIKEAQTVHARNGSAIAFAEEELSKLRTPLNGKQKGEFYARMMELQKLIEENNATPPPKNPNLDDIDKSKDLKELIRTWEQFREQQNELSKQLETSITTHQNQMLALRGEKINKFNTMRSSFISQLEDMKKKRILEARELEAYKANLLPLVEGSTVEQIRKHFKKLKAQLTNLLTGLGARSLGSPPRLKALLEEANRFSEELTEKYGELDEPKVKRRFKDQIVNHDTENNSEEVGALKDSYLQKVDQYQCKDSGETPHIIKCLKDLNSIFSTFKVEHQEQVRKEHETAAEAEERERLDRQFRSKAGSLQRNLDQVLEEIKTSFSIADYYKHDLHLPCKNPQVRNSHFQKLTEFFHNETNVKKLLQSTEATCPPDQAAKQKMLMNQKLESEGITYHLYCTNEGVFWALHEIDGCNYEVGTKGTFKDHFWTLPLNDQAMLHFSTGHGARAQLLEFVRVEGNMQGTEQTKEYGLAKHEESITKSIVTSPEWQRAGGIAPKVIHHFDQVDHFRSPIVQIVDYAGRDLYHVLHDANPAAISASDRKTCMDFLLTQFTYLQNHSILHRDIKPQNVLVNGRYCNMFDFGAALSDVSGGINVTPLYLYTKVDLAVEGEETLALLRQELARHEGEKFNNFRDMEEDLVLRLMLLNPTRHQRAIDQAFPKWIERRQIKLSQEILKVPPGDPERVKLEEALSNLRTLNPSTIREKQDLMGDSSLPLLQTQLRIANEYELRTNQIENPKNRRSNFQQFATHPILGKFFDPRIDYYQMGYVLALMQKNKGESISSIEAKLNELKNIISHGDKQKKIQEIVSLLSPESAYHRNLAGTFLAVATSAEASPREKRARLLFAKTCQYMQIGCDMYKQPWDLYRGYWDFRGHFLGKNPKRRNLECHAGDMHFLEVEGQQSFRAMQGASDYGVLGPGSMTTEKKQESMLNAIELCFDEYMRKYKTLKGL